MGKAAPRLEVQVRLLTAASVPDLLARHAELSG
jgi:hypothetical protein